MANAQDLVAFQSQVDADTTAVAVAQQALAQATILSPLQGTVVQVALTPGQRTTASSTSQAITVIGSTGYEISTSVAVSDLPQVKVGQATTVTVDGANTPLTGKVLSIAAAPPTSSSTNYSVIVALDNAPPDLRDGGSAMVVIDVAHADRVLTVPTSAVRRVGSRHLVDVLTSGKPVTTLVQVGVVGPDRTEVTNGVQPGQKVVLAQLNQPLPASNTTSTNGLNGGRFGGGGFGGGRGAAGGRAGD